MLDLGSSLLSCSLKAEAKPTHNELAIPTKLKLEMQALNVTCFSSEVQQQLHAADL